MRRIRVDIAGITDANGNFSQVVHLDKTGEWRNVKVAIGTTAPAEWALTSTGTDLTYGRGRRVTLGPELLEPFDTLTVSCTGGPVNAAVKGSCTGQAGSEQEIVTAYVPAPNTIALDSLVTQRLIDSFTQAANVVVTNKAYILPAGTQNVRVMVNQNNLSVTFSAFSIVGAVTGINYIPASSGAGVGGFDEWFKPAPPDVAGGILFNLNTTGSANGVEVELVADLAMNFVIAELTGAGTSGAGPILVENTTAAPWQAPVSKVYVEVSNGTFPAVVVAAVVGKTIYVHDWELETDGAAAARFTVLYDTVNGNPSGRFAKLTATNGEVTGSGGGGTLPSGAGISMTSGAINGEFTSAIVWYTQV